VPDLGLGPRRLDVQHHPDHPRHRAGDVELLGAQQRHVADPQLAGGQRRELAVQVRRGGEQHRDEVVGRQPVLGQDLPDQLVDGGQQVVTVVDLQLGRSADRTHGHGCHLLARQPIPGRSRDGRARPRVGTRP
jgi:hypothetical protein